MYTLKGMFPEPKKEPKKNFIKENMKQLKFMQGKTSPKEPKFTMKNVHGPRLTNQLPSSSGHSIAKSSPSNRSGKVSLAVGKSSFSNASKKSRDVRIRKGDMAEFLKRKEARNQKPAPDSQEEDEVYSDVSDTNEGLRDIGCQTIESAISKGESTKLTLLYPVKPAEEEKVKGSGDSKRSPGTPQRTPRSKIGDNVLLETERRSRLNSILERQNSKDKEKDKDPYLPTGYQKGVLPKYLRERKDQSFKDIEGVKADDSGECPPGHVTLPDNERKETLRMLRNSFGELVSELNKMPVKTDTLRMRNRKMELEKQLAKLEEGIKVFSRPKVFVKIGE